MILSLIQGSDEWLKVREQLVTATDFSSIAHRSKLIKYPYAKAKVETHIKNKITHTPQNLAMARGAEYEPIIMEKLLIDNPSLDNLIIQVNNNMASFDAVDIFSGIIREIKTSSTALDKIKLLIPGYVCQVIHQAYILYDELAQSISLKDLDCKIVLLQFYYDDEAGEEATRWHIINVNINDEKVVYNCNTLGIDDTMLDITIQLWRELCDDFYIELINYHNTLRSN